MKRNGLWPLAALVVLSLAALLAFAACGDDDEEDGNGEQPTAAETPAGDQTPAEGIDITGVSELEDGVLTIGSDIAYAPMEFYIEGTETPDGLDVDIGKAIGALLGVEVEFVNSGFDGIIPALNTEEFDIIMSAMTVTDERSAEVDFVEYLSVGTGMLVPADNPNGIETPDDLCGLTVAVQLGTIQETVANDLSADCAEPINVVTFDTNPLAVEDLRTGGADANLSDYPVAYVDAQASDGELAVLPTQIGPDPYGIAVRKGSTALRGVLQLAVGALIASGEYETILAKWDLASAALP